MSLQILSHRLSINLEFPYFDNDYFSWLYVVMVKRYRTVKLPVKMFEAVEQLVKDHPEYGYSSIADFVKDAVRHHYLWCVHRIKVVEA